MNDGKDEAAPSVPSGTGKAVDPGVAAPAQPKIVERPRPKMQESLHWKDEKQSRKPFDPD